MDVRVGRVTSGCIPLKRHFSTASHYPIMGCRTVPRLFSTCPANQRLPVRVPLVILPERRRRGKVQPD
jgi:hypothetical protein